MIYLDANVVVASVVNAGGASEQVARRLRSRQAFFVSRLADYEARKYVSRFTENAAEENLDLLLARKFHLGTEWEAAIFQALKISRQFKSRLWVDSADTLHVGWALSVEAEMFASFDRDSGPRALAMAVGMKLWPEASAKDFERRKLLKA
jgi:predicted nucleic acid-binding protein